MRINSSRIETLFRQLQIRSIALNARPFVLDEICFGYPMRATMAEHAHEGERMHDMHECGDREHHG